MPDDELLISVVVPVYNVEKYLNECLDSIFDPAARSALYEVIAVNDGSTDQSRAILETYKKYANFRLFDQENQGQGVARNLGIKQARGKYIFFVDSDDYLRAGAMGTMLTHAASSESDIIEFDHVNYYENTAKFAESKKKNNFPAGICEGKLLYGRGFWYAVWARLYRREMLVDHSLYFYPGIMFEDFEWSPRCFFYARAVEYHRDTLYIYRIRPGSTMNSAMGKRACLDSLTIADEFVAFRKTIEAIPENTPFDRELGNTISAAVKAAIRRMYRCVPPEERPPIMEKIKARRHLLAQGTSLKDKLRYYLTRRLPPEIAFRAYDITDALLPWKRKKR